MCNLNDRICRWRSALAAGGSCSGQDLDELESHLREQIGRLVETDLAEDEAFLVARHRLGDPASLSEEFAKVNAGAVWRSRVFWMAGGFLAIEMISQFAGLLSRVCALAGLHAGLSPETSGWFSAGGRVLALAFAFGAAWAVLSGKTLKLRRRLSELTSGASLKARLILLVPAVLIIVFGAGTMLTAMASNRLLRPEDLGDVYMKQAYFHSAWSVLLPLAMAVLMVVLSRRKIETAEA
ncbi:MAG: hypothetical protein GXY33_21840 [Phycisphaerae bacterium]|nr:hypothetical protein [Phycisphaerae bacterium]